MKQQSGYSLIDRHPAPFGRVIAASILIAACPILVFGLDSLSGKSQHTGAHEVRDRIGMEEDSLREAIASLRAEAARLRSRIEQVDDSVRQIQVHVKKGGGNRAEQGPTYGNMDRAKVQPGKDTVQLLSREGTQAFLESIRGKQRTSRDRGFGGGLGPTPAIHIVSMRPVKDLVEVLRSDREFRDVPFDIDMPVEPFFMMGITGYGALGNGLRVGGGFLSGSKSYSALRNDSTYSIGVKCMFGGLLVEKAHVNKNMNWFVGGMFGGSVLEATPSRASNFAATVSSGYRDFVAESFKELTASSLLLELHGGFTYTLVNWFHVGINVSTPLFFSPSGFRTTSDQSVTDGFVTVNPGLRIRIILGNIG